MCTFVTELFELCETLPEYQSLVFYLFLRFYIYFLFIDIIHVSSSLFLLTSFFHTTFMFLTRNSFFSGYTYHSYHVNRFLSSLLGDTLQNPLPYKIPVFTLSPYVFV